MSSEPRGFRAARRLQANSCRSSFATLVVLMSTVCSIIKDILVIIRELFPPRQILPAPGFFRLGPQPPRFLGFVCAALWMTKSSIIKVTAFTPRQILPASGIYRLGLLRPLRVFLGPHGPYKVLTGLIRPVRAL